jgi:hypothetical protein
MSSVLGAPEEDIKAAWDILHGSRDDERRHIKKSLSGDYVSKVDKDAFVEEASEGAEFPDPPQVLWIADEDLLATVANQRNITLD